MTSKIMPMHEIDTDKALKVLDSANGVMTAEVLQGLYDAILPPRIIYMVRQDGEFNEEPK